ncbi:MAG: hypothetical protein IT159_09895 [Bryobacterales bacterium]|nr:hypothetical protein [Bryobacterales bacterium]
MRLGSLLLCLASCCALAQDHPLSLPRSLNGGAWPTGHVQGIAVDLQRGFVYYSFTTLLVKTDLAGRLIGALGGFAGHLGDLAFNPADGLLYGSLEYKAQQAFYIAIIDVDKIVAPGLQAQKSAIFRTVYLPEAAADYSADMNGDGFFDGDTAATADHRYGCSGIDGVSFGPRFGRTGGKQYLTVAYGVYSNLHRADNDHQVLLQYDVSRWPRYARPLDESAPHRGGPARPAGKYFVYTGNTNYGVQNLEYDASTRLWFLGVYAGAKPGFPNYTLFAVEAAAKPRRAELRGTGERGLLLPLAPAGLWDAASGVRGWFQKADVGIASLGGGFFYIAVNSGRNGLQTADLTLCRWTGDPHRPFRPVP